MTRLYESDAELYDIAFGWDVEEEVDWLLARLGPACRSVLEPGCGSGRILEPLLRRGLEVAGVDSSPAMLELARRRAPGARVVEVDMTSFDLGRRFDGAVCPINTLLHLDPDALQQHLDCMARHLAPGATYLVQVGLVDPLSPAPSRSCWEEGRGGTRVRVEWVDEELDPERSVSIQCSRIEVLAGPRAGEVLEERHRMTLWTPRAWRQAIAASPFDEAATFDGNERGRPEVGADAVGGLLWHDLRSTGSTT